LDLLHQQVLHPRYGTGEITGQSRRQLSVRFSPESMRRFLYPAAFFGHLTLCDPACRAELEQELEQSPEAAAFLRQRELRRALRQKEQERLVLAARRKASIRPPIRKRTPPPESVPRT
jgi:hypothetical protein